MYTNKNKCNTVYISDSNEDKRKEPNVDNLRFYG